MKSKDFKLSNVIPIKSKENKKKGGKKKQDSDDDEEEKGETFMVEMVDYENNEDQVLLEGIVKQVVEQFLKKNKIEFYTGEIDDVGSL